MTNEPIEVRVSVEIDRYGTSVVRVSAVHLVTDYPVYDMPEPEKWISAIEPNLRVVFGKDKEFHYIKESGGGLCPMRKR